MAELPRSGHLLLALWGAVGVQVAGQIVDLRWHATHAGFETAADQVRAHWLIWVGVILTLFVAAVGARTLLSKWHVGYRLLLIAVLFYVGASAWHFWEHYYLRDPDAPHVALAVGKVAMLAGAISATLLTRRRRGAPESIREAW